MAEALEDGTAADSGRYPRQIRTEVERMNGIGLAIVRGIVEAHAGRAEVRNVQGGCCFSVTLPTA